MNRMVRGWVNITVSALWFFASSVGRGQEAAETRWSAQWITAAGAAERDQVVLHFRKTIELKQAPTKFVVDVSADNQFILYVNGVEAGRGPSRADLAHWRYETYDIGPLLHAGRNALAATVWHFGTHAAIAQMSERAGFLLHGVGEAERVADTNVTWEVEEETGISLLKPKVNGYFAAEPGERWDGGRFDWYATGAIPSANERSLWNKAVRLGRGALREEQDAPNNWQLVRDSLPPMERTEMAPGKVVRTSCAAASGKFLREGMTLPARSQCSVLVDNGELTTGYPVVTASEGHGATIRLTYAEALLDDRGQKGNRNQIEGKHIEGVVDEFLPGGGSSRREFSPLSWRTWRYLQIDVETYDEPVKIEALRTWFSAYPFVEKAYFHADDASLDPIWKIGWRTARLDAHDTYMDTPYWERLQYVGDTRIQALISYTVAGDDRLARQAIEAFDASRVPDGLTQSRYPSSLVQMIPTFSLMWVGMVHDFWMYRGDAEFVRGQVAGARTALDWFLRRQRADGLLGRISWWPFVDWGADFRDGVPSQDEDGGSAVMTLQFVEALRYGAELERAFGDASLAEKYEKAAERASRAVRKFCWNDKFGLLADTPAQKHFSQHANILGVWLDVIPAERQKEVLAKILSRSDAGIAGIAASGEAPAMTPATYYFRFYLARAVEHAGMGDGYLKLLEPWREMVGLGLTTWAESPEPTRSDSHAWSAHPNYDFLRIVAGIRPGSAGFEKVVIEPHLGELKEVKAAMPLPKGMVEVEYRRVGNGWEAKVTLPAGISGDLVWNRKLISLHAGENVSTLK
ncbi:MAG TPA: alpha-L-rhamnosidase C-terminal domain-containing protein [Candidatus Acidoferrum sp.]|nr:alpha-L-rhamnosidase C-terminal domain-containing protein [Candidatus Acidoferrum sp.]